YKHKGEDKNTIKVEKPTITPINANAGLTSPFVKNILEEPTKPIAPKFLDYQKDITFGKSGIAEVLTIKNTENSIFRMSYRFNIGSNNYKLLQYAASYLPFLSTDKYTAEELSKQFYNIACTYSLNVGTETTTINISGLQENFDKAVALVEHIFANVKANEKALGELKNSILKSRENAKLNKSAIMNGLTSYAQYGQLNPFNNVLSNDEVKNIKAEDLIYTLKNLNNYEHVITYYGPQDLATFTAFLLIGVSADARDRDITVVAKSLTLAAWSKNITAKIEDGLHYPSRMGSGRSFSGIVSVRFHCSDTDAPTDVVVYRKSGERSLDVAATRAVSQIRTLHPMPKPHNLTHSRIQTPARDAKSGVEDGSVANGHGHGAARDGYVTAPDTNTITSYRGSACGT
ncbi:MAG: hypothetical protein EOO89_29565, partial [Pedobacter sp.]